MSTVTTAPGEFRMSDEERRARLSAAPTRCIESSAQYIRRVMQWVRPIAEDSGALQLARMAESVEARVGDTSLWRQTCTAMWLGDCMAAVRQATAPCTPCTGRTYADSASTPSALAAAEATLGTVIEQCKLRLDGVVPSTPGSLS